MATASSYFPLASEDPCTSDCGSDGSPDSGSVAGASGSSPGSINISHGAMIAIIVVVAVVAVVGSELRPDIPPARHTVRADMDPSLKLNPLLCRQEERMED